MEDLSTFLKLTQHRGGCPSYTVTNRCQWDGNIMKSLHSSFHAAQTTNVTKLYKQDRSFSSTTENPPRAASPQNAGRHTAESLQIDFGFVIRSQLHGPQGKQKSAWHNPTQAQSTALLPLPSLCFELSSRHLHKLTHGQNDNLFGKTPTSHQSENVNPLFPPASPMPCYTMPAASLAPSSQSCIPGNAKLTVCAGPARLSTFSVTEAARFPPSSRCPGASPATFPTPQSN